MKRFVSLLLVLTICIGLCACGGTQPAPVAPAPTVAPTEAPTEAPTDPPVPDIAVYVKVPVDWQDPACWAWKDGGADAFEAWPGVKLTPAADGWCTVAVPGWIDRIVINGNGGTVQTVDLEVNAGMDLWIHVVNADYAFAHYQMPSGEQMEAELNQPALDYHEKTDKTLLRGGYQISDVKFITFNARRSQRYSTDYIPAELQPEKPEDIYYIIRLVSMDKTVGYYMGIGMKSAVKPGVKVKIVEVATEKTVMESETFMGGDPPQSIKSTDSGRGKEPNEAEIEAWIQSAIEKIMKNPPQKLPEVKLNVEGLTEEEKAVLEAKEKAERLGLSYTRLVEWLVEYENYTEAAAKTAADNCGVDFMAIALRRAEELALNENGKGRYYSYARMVDYLVDILEFTKEEATYAADNCGADWMEQARLEAQRIVDDEEEDGYSERELRKKLFLGLSAGGAAFTQEETAYAMENLKVDWNNEAVKRAKLLMKYSDTSFTKNKMVKQLSEYYQFTVEQAEYAAQKVGLE